MGANYGVFFGDYDYTEALGPRIGGVSSFSCFSNEETGLRKSS